MQDLKFLLRENLTSTFAQLLTSIFINRLKLDDSNNGDSTDDKEDDESETRNTVTVGYSDKKY